MQRYILMSDRITPRLFGLALGAICFGMLALNALAD